MLKLNDTHLVLLSSASRHSIGSFYPLPDTLAEGGDRVAKAVATLLKCGLAAERETSDPGQARRTDGDIRYGVFITDAGVEVLNADEGHTERVPSSSTPKLASTTKAGKVLTLLQRGDGATMAELVEATGWLPHTTRAALTGLRKKGHAIERGKRDVETCYRIPGAA
jgi:hypothetical protein